jgi:hypothetical protein
MIDLNINEIINLQYLSLSGTFTLIDSAGNTLQGTEYGQLLLKGNSVCHYRFIDKEGVDENTANAICHSMG